jgi:hypothetical protein
MAPRPAGATSLPSVRTRARALCDVEIAIGVGKRTAQRVQHVAQVDARLGLGGVR